VTEGYRHAIASKDYIKINDGKFVITSTGRNGFHAVNGFILNDGDVTISGAGTYTNNQSRGIVVEGLDAYTDDDGNVVSSATPGEGFIVINGGNLDIKTVSKAITAKWDIDDDAVTPDTSDDPNPYVRITGGTINITTTGTPTEGSYGNVTEADGEVVYEEIKLSPEGIEGKQSVYISGGTIVISATDDCINASAQGSAVIEISGGLVYACSAAEDSIDSNGNITISGGTVYAVASASDSGAYDCDGTFTIAGGTIVGLYNASGLATDPSAQTSTQGVAVVKASDIGSAGTTVAIKDASGNVVYVFTLPSSNVSGMALLMSSPDLAAGGTYTMYSNVTVSGGSSFHGLYNSLPYVSGGTSSGSFTLSLVVYSSVGGAGRMGPDGFFPGKGDPAMRF